MSRAAARLICAVLVASIFGCATPDKPERRILYDFGPGPTAAQPPAQGMLAPVVLAQIESSGALDGSAVHYRLGYADTHQLRPYANARWSAPPPQLIHQRLRELLARDRPVLDLAESAVLARSGGAMPRVLRMELEEFSHYFESQARSSGLLRMRVSLMENTPAGEQLLAQRAFVVNKPAPTPDAPGGVRALTAATDAAAEEIGQWLLQPR